MFWVWPRYLFRMNRKWHYLIISWHSVYPVTQAFEQTTRREVNNLPVSVSGCMWLFRYYTKPLYYTFVPERLYVPVQLKTEIVNCRTILQKGKCGITNLRFSFSEEMSLLFNTTSTQRVDPNRFPIRISVDRVLFLEHSVHWFHEIQK